MKLISGIGWLGRLFPAVGILVLPLLSPSAQEKSTTARYSTNASDRAECEHQLNIIYGAIQKYLSKHENRYPDQLSDLMPDFIHDRRMLVCPFVRDRGGLRIWKKRFRELSVDADTSYGYEFSPTPTDYNNWRGLPMKTWQEFKERAVKVVGSKVPIVRCHDHRPWLNLAIDGSLYGSGLYWETNFSIDDSLLSVGALFPSSGPSRPLGPADFPPRNSQAGAQLLDLTEFYNATLTNSWQGFAGNDLAALPSGIQEFDGVRFDIRGVIQLYGRDLPIVFPKKVSGIKVNQKCQRIHFLHAASFLYGSGATNAFYVIHYADGRSQEIPLRHGQQIADWWRDPKRSAVPTYAKQVWTGENEAAKAYEKILGLDQFTWVNDRSDSLVTTIDFDTGPRSHAPFLIAITVE